MRRANSSSRAFASFAVQSTQDSGVSWQYALLLPCCVRPISSPATSIGTPCESSSVARKFRDCCARQAAIAGSSLGPSTPQFHEMLLSLPSRLSSRFASLCFCSYDTRSLSVKPSCAVTKLMLACGRRPLAPYRSDEPVSLRANSPISPPSPRQYARIVSRYLSFHSAQPVGKLPTW